MTLYLGKKLIDSYRKRKAFLEEIKHAIESEQELYCFFYGVTPELKQVPSKKTPTRHSGYSVPTSRIWITSSFGKRRSCTPSDRAVTRNASSTGTGVQRLP